MQGFSCGFFWAVGGVRVVLPVYSYSFPACVSLPRGVEKIAGQVVKHWLLNLEGFSPNLQPLLHGCLSLAPSHMSLSLGLPLFTSTNRARECSLLSPASPLSSTITSTRTRWLQVCCSPSQGAETCWDSCRAGNTTVFSLHGHIHRRPRVRPSLSARLRPCHCHISPPIWLSACSEKQILHPQALLPQSPREREAASVMNAQRERDLYNSGITE